MVPVVRRHRAGRLRSVTSNMTPGKSDDTVRRPRSTAVALVSRYDTPAGLRDLPEGSTFYDAWHDFVNGEVSATFGGPWIDPVVVDAEVVTVRSLS